MNPSLIKQGSITLLIACLFALATIARAQSPAASDADALFQSHQWADAAGAYERFMDWY